MNLSDLLADTAAGLPGNIAVVDAGRDVTYAELWQTVCRVAGELETAGIGRDRMIGLQFGNSVAFIALTYALWRCGAVVVPIPQEMQDAERSELVRKMNLAAVVSSTKPVSEEVVTQIYVAEETAWISVLHQRPANLRELNAALVRFTSGTTNDNKGVVLSHEGILQRITTADDALHVGPDDTVIWCLPMAHHFVVTIIRYLWQGARIVLLRNTACEDFLDEIIRNQGTILYASPFQYDALSRDQSHRTIPSVRRAISTTTALSSETAARLHDRYGIRLMQAYGIIELGLVCVNIDDPEGRPMSVGCPTPGFSLRLVNQGGYADSDNGCGEVEVSGPGFFDAYYDPWIPAGEVMNGEWFHTGDVGRIDTDGFLFLHSRVNSVINVAGMKVFPEEIERVLNSHDSVQESRAYPAKHARLGEVVEADIVLRHDTEKVSENDLRTHCGKFLSSLKVPNRFRFLDRLDRTLTTHKIKRHAKREPSG